MRIITDNPGKGNLPLPGLVLSDAFFLYSGAAFSTYRFLAAINLLLARFILLY